MNSSPKKIVGQMIDDPKILKLVDLCLSDQASPEQWQELSQLIVERKDVCEYYAAQAVTGARLAWISKIDEESEREILERIEKDDLLAAIEEPSATQFSYRRVTLTVGAFCAAMLILFGGLAVSLLYQNHSLPKSNVASSGPVPPTIVVANVPGHSKPLEIYGDDVLDLPEGIFDATTASGMTVQFSGPLKLRVDQPLSWRLIYGKLIAEVNSISNGFTVHTPHASVVDLGTKFGVAFGEDGQTKVLVYEGNVSVTSGTVARKLVSGEGLSIASIGNFQKLDPVSAEQFLIPSGIPTSIIADVQHNSVNDAQPFSIVRGGFREGAPAYVDRVHQWSGVDAGGIPKWMADQDYVQFPNDWKFDSDWNRRSDLEIRVQFSGPVVAYLLMDERLEEPDWLTQRFTKTSITIGLDKGSHEDPRTGSNYKLPQEKGPGRSIDVSLRVWRIVLPDGGELQLGPLGQRNSDWVVPGLVARPL
ncbi:FecR domain-containing protein [Bremerella sp. T1]|uniref:FecR family protein n=1 Tax=Bremerella sp. TYQ1 TaxID=3119568 RepID=UPI001CCC089B|nr:FecR family protein [Bremerella volcania]UBM38148.1 FecR family protein [Bremerella volcania]